MLAFIRAMTLLALSSLSLVACDPEDAGEFGDDDELGEVEDRSADDIPLAVELSSIPAYVNVWATVTGSLILVFDDGANPGMVYAYQMYRGAVLRVRHAPAGADLLRGQNIAIDAFPGDQWVAVDSVRDEPLLETNVSRFSFGGNFHVKPPKPVGPTGDDPTLIVKLRGFVVVSLAN